MTRKGYEQIAKFLKEEDIPLNLKYRIVVELAAVFRADNSRFDKRKFYNACGMEDIG